MRTSYLIALLPIFLSRPQEVEVPPVVASVIARELPIVVLDIGMPDLDADFRWESETTGRLLLALDAHLAGMQGVVPTLGQAPRPPSLTDLPASMTESWVGALRTSGSFDAWTVTLTLCPDGEACFYLESVGTGDGPEAIATDLATKVAEALSRPPAPMDAGPPSRDEYAVLIAGRAAAVVYGLLPPVDADAVGVPRRDPVARAVLIDPTMLRSQWLLGRHLFRHGDPAAAARAFDRAGAIAVARQDRAAALAADGQWEASRDAWNATLAEPRFAIAAAAVSVHLRDEASTELWLGLVPSDTTADPELLKILADRAGAGVTEDVLVRWADSDAADPEPVRRHVHWLAQRSAYEAARERATELARRGAPDAPAFILALDAELGQVTPDSELAADASIEVLLDQARGGARRRDWATVDDRVARILALDPYCPEALALQVDHLMATGRRDAAASALERLRNSDPAWGKRDLPWR